MSASDSTSTQERIDQVLQQEDNADKFATKVIFLGLGMIGVVLVLSWIAPKISVFNDLIRLMGGH